MKGKGEQQREVTSIEELMASGKSAKEKVEFLRKNPEMLAEFMRKQEKAKQDEAKRQRDMAFKKRLRQQEQMTEIIRKNFPDYQPPPLTRDYMAREKRLIKEGYYKPTNQLIRNKFKTAKQEFRQMEVQRWLNMRDTERFNAYNQKLAKE